MMDDTGFEGARRNLHGIFAQRHPSELKADQSLRTVASISRGIRREGKQKEEAGTGEGDRHVRSLRRNIGRNHVGVNRLLCSPWKKLAKVIQKADARRTMTMCSAGKLSLFLSASRETFINIAKHARSLRILSTNIPARHRTRVKINFAV